MTDDEMLPGGKFTGCDRFYETQIRAPYRLLWVALHWLQVWGNQRPDIPAPDYISIRRDGYKDVTLTAYRDGLMGSLKLDVWALSRAIYPTHMLEATMLSIIDAMESRSGDPIEAQKEGE